MLRALLLIASAVGGLQIGPLRAPDEPRAAYRELRSTLDAARAAGTLSPELARLQRDVGAGHPSVRLFLEGYGALLVYDRGRADPLLARSFEGQPSAVVAAAAASSALDAGRQTACVEWATRGLALPADPADPYTRVELLTIRSQCFFYLGRQAEYRADVAAAERLAEQHGDDRARALAWRVAGVATLYAGDRAGAEALIAQAIAINERLDDDRALAGDLMFHPVLPFADRVPLLDRALALAVKAGDRLLEGRIRGTRGAAHILLAQYGAAMRDLLAADGIAQQVGATRNRASHAGNLALMFRELGDYERAEEQARLAIALYRRAENPAGVRQTLSDLGNLGRLRHDLTTALDYQRQVVALNRELGDRLFQRNALLRLGQTHLARQEWTDAERALRESVALSEEAGEPGPWALSLTGLGDVLRLTGQVRDARDAYQRALMRARGTEHEAVVIVRANHGLGLLQARAGRMAEALGHYRAAIARIEQIREGAERTEFRIVYFANQQTPYADAIAALYESHRARPAPELLIEAFSLAERARARAMLDAVASRRAGASPPWSFARVTAALDAGDLLVEFVLGTPHSFVFTVTREGTVTLHRLAERAAVEQSVAELRSLVDRRPADRPDEAALRRASHALYRATLEEALARHLDRRRLIIVADGLLFYAPYEATLRYLGGPYLGDRHEIVRAASAAVFAAVRARPPARPTAQFVGFGDPVVAGAARPGDELVRALERSGFSFAPLPGSRREVATAAEMFGPGRSRVYLGSTFTASAALAELQRPNRIVHFASHAVLDERVPGRSGILVSPANAGAPTLLRAQDLETLTIPVDLITLSGCQTGLGRVVNGEGVLGLSWALGRAGARSVMVTLWSISDAASATAMAGFYRALHEGQSKAAALRTARRTLIHGANPRLKHPYYWAGYALLGDPD
jgi:CHAT domain-containing protein